MRFRVEKTRRMTAGSEIWRGILKYSKDKRWNEKTELVSLGILLVNTDRRTGKARCFHFQGHLAFFWSEKEFF
jgi:hypothetical protein